ncbi:MAG: glutamate-5-semialdehyde dehydrogenase [Verrucomicrobiales bacterium]|jgi:glutamate-5-semialdehyde dehydrogenase
MSDLKEQVLQLGKQAKAAALELVKLSTDDKNQILLAMAEQLLAAKEEILLANAKDIASAEEKGLSKAMVDRLRLDEVRISAIADGIRQVSALPDPVGEIIRDWMPKNGIHIQKKRVPIGVIGIIFESRPNVTSDAAVLCFKAGNATILRGGSEAFHSNTAIATALSKGGLAAGMPEHAVQLIPFTDRESVQHMAEMDQYLDLIVPRGGAGLIERVVSLARMPVIKHYDGICATYIDKHADLEMAKEIAVNAKTQKPGVCNALETLLIHEDVAEEFLQNGGKALIDAGVELRGDQKVFSILGAEFVTPATEEDWTSEYLDLILAVKIVENLDGAIDHINSHGSRHSDCIVTKNYEAAERFLNEIDSATVYLNASTRFSDGEEFGFGAEIGISTDKLHARGPMALEELTSYKYLLRGTGQIR